MIPSRRTLWTLSRLLSGLPVEDDRIAAPAPRSGRIGARLAGLDLAERRARSEASADALEDGDALVKAVDDEDPEGPEPEDEPDEGGPVHDRPPIRLGTLPPAEPFPLDVLPLPVRRFVEDVARSVGCPVDFPAAAALGVASAAIGRSASLLIKTGYRESACLWLAIVAGPSTGKSPAIGQVCEPIKSIAAEVEKVFRRRRKTGSSSSPRSGASRRGWPGSARRTRPARPSARSSPTIRGECS